MSDNPELRDKAIARLAAEALRSSDADSTCPDAELLAAYAERGLSTEDTKRWDGHFASCAHCRKMLALLAVTMDQPQQEERPSRELVPTASIQPGTAASKKPIARPRPSPLRWLVPALSAAAAVALWFALRPVTVTPTTQIVAELPKAAARLEPVAPATSSPDTNSPVTNLPSANSEVAQAKLPPPPPAPSTQPTKQIAPRRDFDELKKDQEVAPPAAPPTTRFGTVGSANSSSSAEARAAAPAAPPASSEADASHEQALATVTTETPLLEAENRKTVPPPAPLPNAGSSGLFGGRLAQKTNESLVTLTCNAYGAAATGDSAPVFSAPGANGARWQLGPGGRIERSDDRGRTWQEQSSGVTLDLVAGAALSNQTAWIIGRSGLILRTTDGQQWQRVTPPQNPSADWENICLSDNLHVSIRSSDGRGLRTDDAGRTWFSQ